MSLKELLKNYVELPLLIIELLVAVPMFTLFFYEYGDPSQVWLVFTLTIVVGTPMAIIMQIVLGIFFEKVEGRRQRKIASAKETKKTSRAKKKTVKK